MPYEGDMGVEQTQTKEISQVEKRLKEEDRAIEGLHKTIEVLLKRLEPVLSPETSQPKTSPEGDEPIGGSLITIAIVSQTKDIEKATRKLADLGRRLEI